MNNAMHHPRLTRAQHRVPHINMQPGMSPNTAQIARLRALWLEQRMTGWLVAGWLLLSWMLVALSTPLALAHNETSKAAASPTSHEGAYAVGPKGGRLLQQDDFAIEITMFERGIEPEMRIYSYAAQQPLPPDAVQLQIQLTRLDGPPETLSFSTEQDYAVSNRAIAEPHSYHVQVQARYQGRDYQWQFDNEEGRITLSERVIAQSGIRTERASARRLQQQIQLFGVIAVDPTRHLRLQSPYPATVQHLWVTPGQQVSKGQPLLELRNSASLKNFTLSAPASGMVTLRHVNPGQVVSDDTLLEIVDVSQVNVELSVFPNDLPMLQLGQSIAVMDLHNTHRSTTSINFIAPVMTDGHIARVRAPLANPQGQWRPGMHINAQIQVAEHPVAIAVPHSAVQQLQGREVVFIRVGDTFELRVPTFGRRDERYIEVLSGLNADVEVVTTQSYLLKAELEKEGLSHAH